MKEFYRIHGLAKDFPSMDSALRAAETRLNKAKTYKTVRIYKVVGHVAQVSVPTTKFLPSEEC